MPVYGPTAASKSAQRYEATMAAQGYFAENYQRDAANASATTTTGTVFFMGLGLAAGDVVTNIVTMCAGIGSGFSGIGMKVGVYSKAAALLAQSGDVSGQVASTGAKSLPLSAPYTVLTTDAYYLAILAITSSAPTLNRSNQNLVGLGPFSGGTLNVQGVQTGQTDLPATATISTVSTFGFWVGAS